MQTVSDVFHKIYPTLEKMEAKRKKLLRQSKNVLFVCLGAISLVAIFSYLLEVSDYQIPLVMIGFIILISYSVYNYITDTLKNRYKSEVIGSIITSIDPSFQYDPIQTIPFYKFRNSQLFDSPDKYSGEDYITGRIGKTDFELAEILMQKEINDSDRGKTYRTTFKGLFMVADFHKDFQGHTIIVPDNMGESWFGRNFKSSSKRNMKRAKMENIEFEKAFDVFTTDQVEARYILSVSMLENIVKLKQTFKNDIFFAFHDSCIYIIIRQGSAGFLAPQTKKSLLLESTIHAYFDEFWQVLDIIEELNLNIRIWSKQ